MNLLPSESTIEWLILGLWRASWQASVLAGLVLVVQFLIDRRLGGRGRYLLWSVVVFRLFLPALPESNYSVYNIGASWSRVDSGSVEIPLGPTISTEASDDSLPIKDEPMISSAAIPASAVFWSWSRVLFFTWFIGMGLIAVRIATASVKWKRSLDPLNFISDREISQLVVDCSALLKLRHSPPVLLGPRVRTPAVVGVIRPFLLLPDRVLKECNSQQLRLIILHELAHVKRGDVAANWLVTLATLIHWFNPIVWLIAARIRADREIACDETVLSNCVLASDSRTYGETLIKLIETLSPMRARQPQLVGILEPSGPMQRRMRMIAQYTPSRPGRWVWVSVILLALGCTSLTDTVRGQAQASGAAQRTIAPETKRSPAMQPYESGAPVDMEAGLRKVVPEVQFDEVPFGEVVGFLRDFAKLNITVNWRALEAAGIDRQAPVTLSLRDVPFEQVLRQILRDVGGGAVRLHYLVEGNVLSITTEEETASVVKTVFYDVSDLMVGPEGSGLDDIQYAKKMDRLIQVICGTIASDSWRDNGGHIGNIAVFNGKLVIAQTPENQKLIAQLLSRLREKPTTQPRPLEARAF